MPTLLGQRFTRNELLRRVGDLSQIAGIRMMTLAEGPEAGVRIADVRTGSGLRFQVTLDRGMDISVAEHRGLPLAWRSAGGDVHPTYFDPRGLGWLRTFPGGLLTGCGMTFAGAPCTDNGAELGLHGRLSHLTATHVSAAHEWVGDECIFTLRGSVRESAMFGENMLLERAVETRLGQSLITLRDTVTNEGGDRTPLMMLYHSNPGWPLVAAGARLLMNAKRTAPRDEEAQKGMGSERTFTDPVAGFREQVFYHDLIADQDGRTTALLHNPSLPLALFVRFRQRELPRFVEWKMTGEGTYVLGMEPANCGVAGRAAERRSGTLEFLAPGEQRGFELQIGVLEEEPVIAAFIETNNLT